MTEIQFARNSIVAQLLDFGDLRVETFSGMVAMKDIPHPNEVKDLIQREIERVKARARASERNAIRDELTKRIITQEVPRDQPAAPRAADLFRAIGAARSGAVFLPAPARRTKRRHYLAQALDPFVEDILAAVCRLARHRRGR